MNIEEIQEGIKSYYNDEKKYYHNFNHIVYGLNQIKNLNENGISIEKSSVIAWLFHDIVYDPFSKDNEENSANFMISFLKKTIPLDVLNESSAIILDTKKHTVYYSRNVNNAAYILDIDMSTLSQSYDLFLTDRINVIKEVYAFNNNIEIDLIKKGTLSFIDKCLKSEVFSTPYYKKQEMQLTQNLTKYKNLIINDNFIYDTIKNIEKKEKNIKKKNKFI